MTPNDVWHVQVDDRVYQAETDELAEWIKEGSVLPEDKVRRGDLRWLPAGRIPQLSRFFITSNINDADVAPDPLFEIERNGTVENAAVLTTDEQAVTSGTDSP